MLKKYKLKNYPEIPRLISVVLDQGLMSIITLLTTIVLVRTYDKVDYADLVLLFSISIFVLGFQSSIISKPYAISLNDYNQASREEYYQFNIQLKLLFTLLTCLVFPLLYCLSFDTWSAERFGLFLFYAVAYTSYFFVRETLLSERKTKQNLILGIICSVSIMTVLSFIYFNNIDSIQVFLGSVSLIYLFIVLGNIIKKNTGIKLSKKQFLSYWKSNWKTGKWLLGSNLLYYVSSSMYPWFLLYLSSKEDIAIFAVLMSAAGLVNPILIAFSSYLLPLFVRVNTNYSKILALTKKWRLAFATMAITLIFIGFTLGEYLITFLFGEKYSNLGILVIYPFIYQAMSMFFQSNKIALNAIKRTDVDFYILIPRSIITLILGYLLITSYGLPGVFYTMLTENLFYQLTYYSIYNRIIKNRT